MNKYAITLEFNKIIEMLMENAVSPKAQERLSLLQPYLSESECKRRMKETTDSKRLLESLGTPPLSSMNELDKILDLCSKGAMLVPEQFEEVLQFLLACRRMKSYLKRAESQENEIAYYGSSIDALNDLCEEIERSIRNGRVDDSASPKLKDIRRRKENAHQQIRSKLESILRGKKEWFADSFVSMRNGHFVLPVKKEYKNMVAGSLIETSATGGTYFIEPSVVRRLQEDISTLSVEEENEERKILYTLTSLVDEQLPVFKINVDIMETLDAFFAKAKLSVQMKATAADIHMNRRIVIKAGRHPLLNQSECVPLDFEIGNEIRGVVITGPNTGGKTVALKTVGLLSLMAQSGLHVPAAPGSEFSMHNMILCDIGDGQSITENLSTFSAHITTINDILKQSTVESLVLLDEVGSGTDPAEGMGIATAILEELKNKGCLFVATTHYPEIKDYARNTPGLVNARMAFDKESLKPLYRLEIGEAGESCALYIAKRLGFPAHLLRLAHEAAYKEYHSTKVIASENKKAFLSSIGQENQSGIQPDLKSSVLIRENLKRNLPQNRSSKFNIGDSVMVFPQKVLGLVYQKANEHGEIGVQIKGQKKLIPHKRLKLHVLASELYPPDYDFSIIFDTVENRKARHKMGKRHNPDLIIEYDNDMTEK
ncbi:endonuclease MutS2 [Ruminiclostridium papyrosolvens]|uniref:DNA mismatch repair protein MutS n=1 Tax=Ruminiclostridium papyrosolvens C7 TaxID=1330534 RepID=U4QXC4_9FIRM|nr:DNA mismatch repair protein MutS [Ruminiclostridium papyrosolvens]EPR09192.1 DNA mismatch repair protein MutS [Ruminiclostridium papyrosolvens C7]